MLFHHRVKPLLIMLLPTLAVTSCGDPTSMLPVEPASTQQPSPFEATFESEFVPNMQGSFHRFAYSVAISGDTVVAGAPGVYQPLPPGLAYVFVRNGSMWTEQAAMVSNAASAGEFFGISVAIVGDLMVVGSSRENVGANVAQGVVHVFARNGTTWTEEPVLTANDGMSGDGFGASVAMSGNTLLVGATGVDVGMNNNQGAVYAFVRQGTSWTQQAKFVTNDGGILFGKVVTLDGDHAAILSGNISNGAFGSPYVFARNGSTWTQEAKLNASSNPSFGPSLAISGNTVFVGAYNDTGGGAAYVFVRQSQTWELQAKLVASDRSDADNFGVAVAVSGNIGIVGAPEFDVGPNAGTGQAYVFERQGSHWTEKRKITAPSGSTSTQFGAGVVCADDTAIIIASRHSVLGATRWGKAYSYSLTPSKANGDACTSGQECWSTFCVDGVCCNQACSGGDTNDCAACSVAAGAPTDGQCAPVSAGIQCNASVDECIDAAHCDGISTACPAGHALNNTPCTNGTCVYGTCTPIPPPLPPVSPPPQPPQPPNCQIRLTELNDGYAAFGTWMGLAVVAMALRRRRRS